MTSFGRSAPAKGVFMPSAPHNNDRNESFHARTPSLSAMSIGKTTGSAPQTVTLSSGVPTKISAFAADPAMPASVASSVPKGGRRRESIGAQMRKQLTDSTAFAAGGGGGLTFQRSMGQTVMPLFGTGRDGSTAASNQDLSSSVPASLRSHVEGAADRRERRGSASSVASDDDGNSSAGIGQALHRCEACNKVYRHPNCLVKHRWEHTAHWKEASRFSMSKHQQVQLLEAAAILFGMDAEAASLPEEKALWPAAVSAPTSGLLGSDKFNFELMQRQRLARSSQSPSIDRRRKLSSSYSSESMAQNAFTPSASLPARGASLSPVHGFTSLSASGRPRAGTLSTGIASLRLDESAERGVREEDEDGDSAADESQDEDDDDGFNEGNDSMTGSTSISAGSPSHEGSIAASDKALDNGERYGLDAGGDVMAEMDMEMET